MKKAFITTVHTCEEEQIMYAYTDTREQGLLKALAYISEFEDSTVLKNSLIIKQKPNK